MQLLRRTKCSGTPSENYCIGYWSWSKFDECECLMNVSAYHCKHNKKKASSHWGGQTLMSVESVARWMKLWRKRRSRPMKKQQLRLARSKYMMLHYSASTSSISTSLETFGKFVKKGPHESLYYILINATPLVFFQPLPFAILMHTHSRSD